jgi:hypothetical protein
MISRQFVQRSGNESTVILKLCGSDVQILRDTFAAILQRLHSAFFGVNAAKAQKFHSNNKVIAR